ncbi:MAG: single-stranded-DNA-specific exonuclease RecJ [Bryobacteraceae bacterium]|nr:single-stranded-DNA-specific exonuclease RecJ [Bryobacteraceae bacterium]
MRWHWPEVNEEAIGRMGAALSLQAPAARVLWSRGYRDLEAAEKFLNPSFSQLLDPYAMHGMREAVERLLRAIALREKILIYGDYDVDGTCSVVILRTAIELCGGARPDFHLPHRLRDGYGMRPEVVDSAAEGGVRLIISVDTGIRASDVVRHARDLDIDVIVTDHHLPEADLPPAVAVLNPNQPACTYPCKELCGAGVVFKLAQALIGRMDWPPPRRIRILESLLKLVAIATVADVVPLTGENRVMVRLGLDGLREVKNLGLRALLDTARVEPGVSPTARQVAFQVAPRINAAGRMASARDVIELFSTSSSDRAREIASRLDELNVARRATEDSIRVSIEKQCEAAQVDDSRAALVFAGEGWHRGVVGIVASRMVEKFGRPVFVLGIENGLAQGSGRSISEFHLLESLEAMSDLFVKFGGHRQAAGLTLPADRLAEFERRWNEYALARLGPEDFVASIEADALIPASEITPASLRELLRLAPFGAGNPNPLLAVRGLTLAAPPEVMKDKHLKFLFRGWKALAWNGVEHWSGTGAGIIDAVLCIEEDPESAAKGYSPVRAVVKDLRQSAGAASRA